MSDPRIFDLPKVRLSVLDVAPEGESTGTILLIHGFGSRASVNWAGTSWIRTLTDAGYRCIAPDNRGHGASQKFYDAADYGPDIMAEDAVALLDALEIERCHVMGYSMGARISAWLAAHHPQRVEKLVLGGMAEHIFGGRGGYLEIAEALETEDPGSISDEKAKGYRIFADRVGADRLALAACIRPSVARITPETIAAIEAPTLVAVGGDDEVSGRAQPLVAMLKNGRGVTFPGLDHMRATGAAPFKEAVTSFLAETS